MIAELQVLPRPAGTEAVPYANVEAAIATLGASGLRVEVGALGTTIEGAPNAVWAALRASHEATLAAGADSVVSIIKLAESAGDAGPGIDDLAGPFRD